MIVGVLAKPPRFLTVDEVRTLHETGIDEHGGSHGLRDAGLLDSAHSQPAQSFDNEFVHAIPFGMAAAYAFHICKNHPFVDGNKRTAFAAMVVFLRLNGWVLDEDQAQAEALTLRIARNEVDKAGVEDWLGEHCRARPSMELRELFQSLDEQQLMDHLVSTLRAPSPSERFASLIEAYREFPLVQAFVDTIELWHSRGEDERCEKYGHNVILLIAIYRLAEDMGYEW